MKDENKTKKTKKVKMKIKQKGVKENKDSTI